MTLDEVMKPTNKGTIEPIEQFKIELQNYGLIGKHQSLDHRAVTTFTKAVEYNESKQNIWSDSIQRAIQEEYGEEMELPFIWTKEIILKNLIWKINNGKVKVKRATDGHNEDFHIFYEIIIGNFQVMGKTIDIYNNSRGTDGNPTITFICKGNDYIYYLVGKHNNLTKTEDIHVFYNDGIEFNIMKCEHICGGGRNNGILEELWLACSSFELK